MHGLAERLLAEIKRHEMLKAGDRVGVAVSGGIDSVALLRLLVGLRGGLGIVLSVVHFNHRLRGEESDADERFVSELARAHGLAFFCDSEDVGEFAARERVSVEAAARELRYGFFRHLLSEGTSGAEAPEHSETTNRSAESAAPPKDDPHGLKSHPVMERARGPEGPLFHAGPDCDIDPQRPDSNRLDSKLTDSRYDDSPSEQQRATLSKLDKVVTGHTLNDQAETVLLRLIRGTGVTGLGGIHPLIAVEDHDGWICGEIVRPLLGTRRCELEQYLSDIGQDWREDSTNADDAFTRNRLRRLVLPLLEKEFNPAVAENLAELAEIARGEEEYWDNEVAGWMGTAVQWIEPDWARRATQPAEFVQISLSGGQPTPDEAADLQVRIDSAEWLVANASVSRPWLLSESVAVQRRVVKAIGEHAGISLEFKHVEDILHFAGEEHASGELSLPRGWRLVLHPEELLFVTPDLREARPLQDYEHDLSVPGRVFASELGIEIEALRIPADQVAEYNPDELLDIDSLPGPLRVRNWRAGDRFWPAHTKSPKKIKELLQDRHVAQPERASWPVIVSGNEIVWVRGFPIHAKHLARKGGPALLLVERSPGVEST